MGALTATREREAREKYLVRRPYTQSYHHHYHHHHYYYYYDYYYDDDSNAYNNRIESNYRHCRRRPRCRMQTVVHSTTNPITTARITARPPSCCTTCCACSLSAVTQWLYRQAASIDRIGFSTQSADAGCQLGKQATYRLHILLIRSCSLYRAAVSLLTRPPQRPTCRTSGSLFPSSTTSLVIPYVVNIYKLAFNKMAIFRLPDKCQRI